MRGWIINITPPPAEVSLDFVFGVDDLAAFPLFGEIVGFASGFSGLHKKQKIIVSMSVYMWSETSTSSSENKYIKQVYHAEATPKGK